MLTVDNVKTSIILVLKQLSTSETILIPLRLHSFKTTMIYLKILALLYKWLA